MSDSIYLTRAEMIKAFPTLPKTAAGLRYWVKNYSFPAPRYANHNTPLWREEEIQEWFDTLPHSHAKVRGV